ncbi:malonyl-CoA decarboxylase domain-containing protein [Bradyrhizobium cenepequi]
MCDLPDAGRHRPETASTTQRVYLGNGARLERINWLGNTELRAIQESFGIVVNYLCDHYSIENNHEAFVRGRTNVRSPDVEALSKDLLETARPFRAIKTIRL